jgi:hypothetical protein
MSGLDFLTKTQVFRKDFTAILANNRHLVSMMPIRLAYNALGVAAGTVLARNNVSGYYQAYSDIAASGVDTAVGILFHNVAVEDFNSGTSTAAQMIAGGNVYQSKLIGLDAAGITDLGAKSKIDGMGNTILMF